MPADSEPAPSCPSPGARSGPRVVGIAVGAGLLVICAFSWFTFDAETRERFTLFQRGTLLVLGLLAFSLLYGLLRSRVEAHADRLVVVNGYRRREYEWAEIIAVNLPPGAPWVDPRPRRRRDRGGDGHPGLGRRPRRRRRSGSCG